MNELDELRLRIAKAKGWTFGGIDDRKNPCYWVINPRGEFVVNQSRSPETAWLCAKVHFIPDWPNDISAAWELVEEMHRNGYYVKVSTPQLPDNENYAKFKVNQIWINNWSVKVDEKGVGDANPPAPGGWFFGATAPEAICRAWLAWKEG